jgi:hypothetical protein
MITDLIVDREKMPDNYKGIDETADELYLKSRKKFKFFKHKRSIELSYFVVEEIRNVLCWTSPAYNWRKIEVLRHFWIEVEHSIGRINGIKK